MPPLPPQFPGALSNYPKHMYVNENIDGPVRCLATGCNRLFKDENSTAAQVIHYTERQIDTSLSDICRNEHGLLRQLHSLQVCPLCKTLPPRRDNDIRYLFNHMYQNHQDAQDMTTIKGFLITVRNKPENFPDISPRAVAERADTFKLVYEHAKLKLTSDRYWLGYRTLMGYRDNTDPEADFRKFLTDQNNPVEYWPIEPSRFLADLEHDRKRSGLLEGPWGDLKSGFQESYRKGEI